uniref:Uncharacterized protein n=1 Tax=Arundo donax TaxID=35708 RepID=A0A0A8ZPE0_ARUDO
MQGMDSQELHAGIHMVPVEVIE